MTKIKLLLSLYHTMLSTIMFAIMMQKKQDLFGNLIQSCIMPSIQRATGFSLHFKKLLIPRNQKAGYINCSVHGKRALKVMIQKMLAVLKDILKELKPLVSRSRVPPHGCQKIRNSISIRFRIGFLRNGTQEVDESS